MSNRNTMEDRLMPDDDSHLSHGTFIGFEDNSAIRFRAASQFSGASGDTPRGSSKKFWSNTSGIFSFHNTPKWFWPLKVLSYLLMIPFVGIVYVIFGLRKRQDPNFSNNSGDCWLIVFVGITFQFSMCCPLINLVVPGSRDALMQEVHAKGDYVGPVVFYCVAAVYFSCIAVCYDIFRRHGTASETLKHMEALSVKNTRYSALQIKEQLRSSTRVRTKFIVLFAIFVAFWEVFFLRLCTFASTERCNKVSLLEESRFMSNEFFVISTMFWFLLFTVVNVTVFLSIVLHYQQLRQIEEFTYSGTQAQGYRGKNASKKKNREFLADLKEVNQPKNLAVWAAAWQELILDLKRLPLTKSLCIPTFGALLGTFIASISYVTIENLYNNHKVAEFTAGSCILAVFSFFSIFAFVYITVQITKAVEYQMKVISKVQNDVQRTIDEGREPDQETLLKSKVRVLQALDLYLRVADSRPKLIGVSLESLRWGAIVLGLLFMNAFFFALYVTHCFRIPEATQKPTCPTGNCTSEPAPPSL